MCELDSFIDSIFALTVQEGCESIFADLLVTAGYAAASLAIAGKIQVDEGVEAEHELSQFCALKCFEFRFFEPYNASFDLWIEDALQAHYPNDTMRFVNTGSVLAKEDKHDILSAICLGCEAKLRDDKDTDRNSL